MHLLYVTPLLGGNAAVASSSRHLVAGLSRDHDVAVLTGKRPPEVPGRATVVCLPLVVHQGIAGYLSFLAQSTIWLARHAHRYDLVHATGGDCFSGNVYTSHFCHLARLRQYLAGRQVLNDLDGSGRGVVRPARRLLWLVMASTLERKMYRNPAARAILAVSRGLKLELERFYRCPPSSVEVIPNGVDQRRFHPRNRERYRHSMRRKLGLPAEAPVLLFVGTDWGRKGLELAVESLCHLRPDTSLVVVGHGDREGMLAWGRRLGLEGRLVFVGQQLEVERYFALADAFVFPSSYEAFALVVLEAAASGLPSVTTRINGSEDFIVPGANGYFVRRDARDIADKLNEFLYDHSAANRLAECAVESVKAYSWDRVVARVADTYCRLLS